MYKFVEYPDSYFKSLDFILKRCYNLKPDEMQSFDVREIKKIFARLSNLQMTRYKLNAAVL